MARRKRKSRFEKGTEARRMAREKVGAPPAGRVVPDRRLKPAKHKKPLTEDDYV